MMTTKSQKLEAMVKHKKAWQAGMMHSDWNHLKNVYSFDLYPSDEPLPDELDAEPFIEVAKECIAKSWNKWHDNTIFIRACPLQPRPGVLESSPASTDEEAEEIVTRIITTMLSKDTSSQPMYEHGYIDPHGSIMIAPYVNADASCVVAPNNYIMMGEGNDGITASRDCIKVALPQIYDPSMEHDLKLLDIEPDKIELEFVSQLQDCVHDSVRSSYEVNHKAYLVQLRGSEGARPISPPPKGVTISGTFHGEDRITITHIHTVSDNSDEQLDLMEQALREGMPSGAVVIHPTGNHLSHHAGQCYKYGVPYIASNEPKVGEQWTQAAAGWVVLDNDGTYEPKPYDAVDYIKAFKAGIEFGLTNFARQHGWLSNHFHQFTGGPLYNPQQTAVLGGAYVGWLINGTLSVGLGECRHAPNTTNNCHYGFMTAIHAVYGRDVWEEIYGETYLPHDRKHYYAAIENYPKDYETTRGLFGIAIDIFNLNWNAGYGGKKYAESMKNGRDLLDAVQDFFNKPNKTTMGKVISCANITEHNVHNNGYFFNKFMPSTALDWGTDPSKIKVNPTTFFRVFYAALDVLKNTKRNKVTSNIGVIEEYQNLSVVKLKKTPLAINKNFPLLAKSVADIPMHFRHSASSGFTTKGSSNYIQCGVVGCEHCTIHQQHLAKELNLLTVPYPYVEVQHYDMTLPTQTKKSKQEDAEKESADLYTVLCDLKKEVSLSQIKGNEPELDSLEVFALLCYEGQTSKHHLWTSEHTSIAGKIFGRMTSQQQTSHITYMNKLKQEAETNGEEE